MSDPLVAFLHSCIDDDERMALAAKNALDEWQAGNDPTQRWAVDRDAPLGVYVAGEWCCVGEGIAAHIAGQSPERMLAEVDAKREILKRHQPRTVTVADYEQYMPDVAICSTCSYPHGTSVGADEYQPWPCPTVRALLIPYVDRPGYDQAWKVES